MHAPPSTGRAGRAAAVWRRLRAPIAACLMALVITVEVTIVAVVACPIDRAELAPGDDWVSLDEIPSIATAAVIVAEDDGFWDHRGVELRGLVRAAWLDLRAGRVAYGGSTLSMQVARLRFTAGAPRTLSRKVREAILALRLERAFTKRELLEQWWNRADFGNGVRGVGAAARYYFDKPIGALTTAEAVTLACLPRAPVAYDPRRYPEALRARRERVLARLVAAGHLDATAAAAATTAPVMLASGRRTVRAVAADPSRRRP